MVNAVSILIAIAACALEPHERSDAKEIQQIAQQLAHTAPVGGAWPMPAPAPDLVAPHPERKYDERGHVGQFSWTDKQWRAHCRRVRTSYNPDHDLRDDVLTLRPADPRWPDFVFWSLNNKVNEHVVEAFGGTGWKGPTNGVNSGMCSRSGRRPRTCCRYPRQPDPCSTRATSLHSARAGSDPTVT